MANDPLLPRATPPAVFSATVVRDVADGDDAFVFIDGADADQEVGPCMWMPRGSDTPSAGDPCTVAEDHTGGWTIMAWRPA
jgi:hypothetical protein